MDKCTLCGEELGEEIGWIGDDKYCNDRGCPCCSESSPLSCYRIVCLYETRKARNV